MTRLHWTVLAFILIHPFLSPADSTIRMSILPSSHLELEGTSTLHNFKCTTTTIRGEIEMDQRMSSFASAEVAIPAKSIHSESASMNDKMYDAMNAKEYPEMRFSLLPSDSTTQAQSSQRDSLVTLRGRLFIAGKEQTIELRVSINRNRDGILKVDGTKRLLMTDYGIDPPTFMLGVLKTGNEVTVEFHLDLKGSKPVAHTPPANN